MCACHSGKSATVVCSSSPFRGSSCFHMPRGVQLQTANTFSPKFVSESWKLTVVVSVVNEACAGANLKVWKRWLPQR